VGDDNDVTSARSAEDRSDVHLRTARRDRLAGLMIVVVLVGALGSVGAGAVLTNMEWPNEATNWVRFVFGAILTVGGAMLVELSRKQLTTYFRNRTHDAANRYSPLLLSVVDQLSRSRLLAIVGIAVVIFGSAVAAPPLLSSQPVSDLEPGPIQIMSAIDESPTDPRFTLIRQWNLTNPRNPVKFVNAPGETDQQHDSMVEDARNRKESDIYLLDVVWMREFIERSYIRPVDQSILKQPLSDFVANILETCRKSGDAQTLWALPFHTDAGVMFYRSDLVSPPPQTWSGYYGEPAKATLRHVKADTDAAQAKALESASAAHLADEEVLTVAALEAMFAEGSNFVDENGGVLMKNANEVEFDQGALAALHNLASAREDPAILLRDANTADESASTKAMQEGRALFMRNWPVAFDNLTSELGQPNASFGIAPLPWDSVLGGQNLAISSSTDKPRAAQALIEFLTSSASQLMLFDSGGYAPTRISAFVNARRSYGDGVRRAVEQARPRPSLSHYTEFSREFRAGVLRAMNNGGVIESSLPKKLAEIVQRR
jgi:multiple sugar transport system substrate-binding protein